MNWYKKSSKNNLKKMIDTLKPILIIKAQKAYDSWNQNNSGFDEELGSGGICHLIAYAFCEVFSENAIDTTLYHSDGVNHTACIAYDEEGGFIVDIPHSLYETGSGYNWKKIKHITFYTEDIYTDSLSSDDVREWIDL